MTEMNECQNLQQQLDDYLCDRLSDFAKHRIDNHLRQCLDCAKDVQSYQLAINELRSLSQSVKIEPSLALQYSLQRLAQDNSQEKLTHGYVVLIFSGLIIFTLGLVLSVLNYYGAIGVSLVISSISAIFGTIILATGLLQMRRKDKATK